MTEAYDGRQVVGMDLHRQRSVIVRMTEDGRKLETVRITNSPAALREVIARAGKNPRVVIEATYGWYWAVDVLEAAGAEVHLAHPLGVKAYSYRRVKNDLLTELRSVTAVQRTEWPWRPARSHEHGTCAEKGRATGPVQHALQTPCCRETAGRNPA
jgi:transposase